MAVHDKNHHRFFHWKKFIFRYISLENSTYLVAKELLEFETATQYIGK